MNRLKELRLERGLTLKKVSDDLSQKTIKLSADGLAKYERGERQPKIQFSDAAISYYEDEKREPKLATWELLADYFDVDPEYLVGWSDIKRKELISGTAKNVQQKSD